ncbi:MAG TPA: hypothetical protein VHU42_14180 [Rhodopila sp.]|nr:hypothetical protein [Rhodopila sp.]
MSGCKWSCLALAGWLLPHGARAEADTVRITQPYGLLYLPRYSAIDRHMIEPRAAAAGLRTIKVTLTRLASGPARSDMILAGDADAAMGGFGPALTLWDKTAAHRRCLVCCRCAVRRCSWSAPIHAFTA